MIDQYLTGQCFFSSMLQGKNQDKVIIIFVYLYKKTWKNMYASSAWKCFDYNIVKENKDNMFWMAE